MSNIGNCLGVMKFEKFGETKGSLLSKMTLKSVDAKQLQPCVKYVETRKVDAEPVSAST